MKVLSLSRLKQNNACSRRRVGNMCTCSVLTGLYFIYRDLKPENILLDDNGKNSALKEFLVSHLFFCLNSSIFQLKEQ